MALCVAPTLVSAAEAESGAVDAEWLERGSLAEVAAWVDIERLLR